MTTRRSFLGACFAAAAAPAIFTDGIARGILMPARQIILPSATYDVGPLPSITTYYVGPGFEYLSGLWFPTVAAAAATVIGPTTIYVSHDHVEPRGSVIRAPHDISLFGGNYSEATFDAVPLRQLSVFNARFIPIHMDVVLSRKL